MHGACRARDADVLALWERGAQRHPLDRGALLCAGRGPTCRQTRSPTCRSARSRQACCACARRASATASTPRRLRALRRAPGASRWSRVRSCRRPPAPAPGRGRRHGCACAPLDLRDLAAVAGEPDTERAAGRCWRAARAKRDGEAMALADEVPRAVEDALEALDPHADLALAVHCAACGAARQRAARRRRAAVGRDRRPARRLLREVHLLARAYGWTEARDPGARRGTARAPTSRWWPDDRAAASPGRARRRHGDAVRSDAAWPYRGRRLAGLTRRRRVDGERDVPRRAAAAPDHPPPAHARRTAGRRCDRRRARAR